jgi:hypothetical protein
MCGKMSTSENDSDFQRLNCSGAVLCKLQYGLRVFSCKMYSPDVGGCSGTSRPLVHDRIDNKEHFQICRVEPFPPDTSPSHPVL